MYNCPVRWYTVVDEMFVDEMSVYTKCRRRNVRRRIVVEPIGPIYRHLHFILTGKH